MFLANHWERVAHDQPDVLACHFLQSVRDMFGVSHSGSEHQDTASVSTLRHGLTACRQNVTVSVECFFRFACDEFPAAYFNL